MSEEKIVKPTINQTVPPATSQVSESFQTSERQQEVPTTEKESKVEQLAKLTDATNEIKPDVDTLIPSDDYRTSPIFHEIVNYFNIPQSEWDSAKNELSTITDFVIEELGSNDPDKILMKLRELEDTIQPVEWGVERYKNVYRYIRLAARKQAIVRSMSAFEKKGATK